MAIWKKVVVENTSGTISQTASGITGITLGDLAEENQVDSTMIANNAVTSGKINSLAVTTAKIDSLAVTTAKIAADAVTGAKIADDAIDSEHLAADSIDSEHYAAGSVDTTALGANAITGAKVADNAIDSEHYTDGSIDTAHIGDNQITLAKMDSITKGSIIHGDNNGNPAYLGVGSQGDALVVNGSGQIEWGTVSTVGSLNDLDDVSGTPADGDILFYVDGTDKWQPKTLAEADIEPEYTGTADSVVITDGSGKLKTGLGVTKDTLQLLNGIKISETYCPQIDANTSFMMNAAGELAGEAKWASLSCLSNAIGELSTMTFKNNTTFDGADITIKDGSNNTKFSIANSSGNTDIEGTLAVAGDCNFEGIVTISQSEDLTTNNTTFTLNADSNGPVDSNNSAIIVDVNADTPGDNPRVKWVNDAHDTDAQVGAQWYMTTDQDVTSNDENLGDLAIMGMYAHAGAPNENDTPFNQGTFVYDTTNNEFYVCTDATHITP